MYNKYLFFIIIIIIFVVNKVISSNNKGVISLPYLFKRKEVLFYSKFLFFVKKIFAQLF